MKVMISYPPLSSRKGCPTLGQNRQFQYFKEPTYIYPVVPAQAATMLKAAGHEVVWNDSLAEGLDYDQFIALVRSEKPDVIVFESKTPVIKQHWKIIDDVKDRLKAEGGRWKDPIIVLFGDHVTALPEESFHNSAVDFVLTGGDYDFLLLNLCNALRSHYVDGPFGERALQVSPASLESGIYYRENGAIRNTGPFRLDHDLDAVPFIDRDLTRWELYFRKNGNYKRTPGTYIMSGRDCWWGKCTFCSWPILYPKFRSRSPGRVLDEIGELAGRYRVREIMDDTGCFPAGEWLRGFCRGMIERGLNRKIYFDCNMRFGALGPEDFRLMKKANFRLLLFGLESAAQSTLDRINKNVRVERIIEDCKAASSAGLFPHVTIMFGYPWETYEDARRTFELGRWLLKKGYAYTMQATVVIPYPGSPLFQECQRSGWLKTRDWDAYDMKAPVMESPAAPDKIMGLVREMYRVSFSPEFILRKLVSVRDADDIRYFLRSGAKVVAHIRDFRAARRQDAVMLESR